MSLTRRQALLAGVAAATLAACARQNAQRGNQALAEPSPSPQQEDGADRSPAPDAAGSAAPSASPSAGGPAVEVQHGDRAGTAIALTFHGAGDPALASRLLAEAKQAQARVTVLAVGTWLEQNPDMARVILDSGHELGNHTYTHPVLTRLDPPAAFQEIERCAAVLRRVAGSQGKWFRPSGTPTATETILIQAGRAGYARSLSYDVDPADYTDPGADAIVARVKAGVRPGSVVSLHLGHAGTVTALPQILDHLKSVGLVAVTASELFGP